MQVQERYEILEGLPAYGPMYVPVSPSGEPFYSEGFVVKFFPSDQTHWVANFKTGWTDLSLVVEYPDQNKIVVIAYGQGYIMNPEQQEPLQTFGVNINNALLLKDNRIVAADDIQLYIINKDATLWTTERISLDGIKDLSVHENTVSGLSCYPLGDKDEWMPFTVDLATKVVTGGSYKGFFGSE